MATGVVHQTHYAALSGLVRQWDRRWRSQQMVEWLPRSLMPGIVFGIVLALISRVRPWLLPTEILALTLAATAISVTVMAALVWLWPRAEVASAMRFDQLFGLNERTTTALQLLEGRITTRDELAHHQLTDALATAKAVSLRDSLPLHMQGRPWSIAAGLAVLLAVLLLLHNPQAQAIEQTTSQNAVIDEAADNLKDVTEQIATDTTLDEPDRQRLLQTLQKSVDTLETENISPEEALATLSDAQMTLTDEASRIQRDLEFNQDAIRGANDALDNAGLPMDTLPSDSQNPAEEFANSLQNAADSLDQMGGDALDSLSDALRDAADQLEGTDPATSEALREAADALDNGDTEAARDSLEEASRNMEQTSQDQTLQQQLLDQLNEAAQQNQQDTQQLTQPSQDGQPPDDSEMGDNNNSDSTASSEFDSSQDPPTDSDNNGQPSSGNQPPQGDPQIADNEGVPMSSGSTGSGDTDAPADSSQRTQSDGSPIDQDNNPDGTGEKAFEPIYSPQRLGGEGTDTIILEPDPGDMTTLDREFSENPTGDVTVPYNQVFSTYQDAANAALNADYIPLGLRDVVHDYFTSLDPQQ